MKTYLVTWDIEIDAETPKEAAEQALDYIINGSARVFEVESDKESDTRHTVDLFNDTVTRQSGFSTLTYLLLTTIPGGVIFLGLLPWLSQIQGA